MNGELQLRPSTKDDARLLFDWRNDEDTRAMSGDTVPLVWESHLEWFIKILSGGSPGRFVYIVETAEGEPVGTVRSDERPDGFTEVSYTVASEWRGKGVGKRMMLQFAKEKLAGKKLTARIKKGVNPASEAIARSLGLQPFSETLSDDPIQPPVVEWR